MKNEDKQIEFSICCCFFLILLVTSSSSGGENVSDVRLNRAQSRRFQYNEIPSQVNNSTSIFTSERDVIEE